MDEDMELLEWFETQRELRADPTYIPDEEAWIEQMERGE